LWVWTGANPGAVDVVVGGQAVFDGAYHEHQREHFKGFGAAGPGDLCQQWFGPVEATTQGGGDRAVSYVLRRMASTVSSWDSAAFSGRPTWSHRRPAMCRAARVTQSVDRLVSIRGVAGKIATVEAMVTGMTVPPGLGQALEG
jgi:hypothetical protein